MLAIMPQRLEEEVAAFGGDAWIRCFDMLQPTCDRTAIRGGVIEVHNQTYPFLLIIHMENDVTV
jgi:hypothetical protein